MSENIENKGDIGYLQHEIEVIRSSVVKTGKSLKPVVAAFLIPVLAGVLLSAFRNSGELKNVTIISDGHAMNFSTSRNFVGEALQAAKVEFDEDDIIMPPAMATLVNGEVISVKRITRETVERDIQIPFETMILKNKRIRAGSEVELRAGAPGMRRDIVEIETIDGARTGERMLTSDILVNPVSRKIYLGTRTTGNTVSSLRMQATAYTAGAESCWPSVDGLTAVMKKAGYGVAAVDPRVIQLGTRLYIEGYGFAVASDVGGAIKGHKIDLFMADVGTARAFGRRPVTVYLLD